MEELKALRAMVVAQEAALKEAVRDPTWRADVERLEEVVVDTARSLDILSANIRNESRETESRMIQLEERANTTEARLGDIEKSMETITLEGREHFRLLMEAIQQGGGGRNQLTIRGAAGNRPATGGGGAEANNQLCIVGTAPSQGGRMGGGMGTTKRRPSTDHETRDSTDQQGRCRSSPRARGRGRSEGEEEWKETGDQHPGSVRHQQQGSPVKGSQGP